MRIEELSVEAFRPYGAYQDLYDVEAFRKTPPGDTGFYPDLMALRLGRDTLPAVCISKIKRRDMRVTTMEYHRCTAEWLLPLDGDCAIFVGQGCKGFAPEHLRSFRIPQGVAVHLNPGTVHGTQFPLDQEWVRVLILLPEHTYDNDVVKHSLSEAVLIEK